MSASLSSERRSILRRRVRIIVGVTIGWNLLEAAGAVTTGALASSGALIGFGLDSLIEVASALTIAWQFHRRVPERWERVAVRVIALAFFALAASLAVDAVLAFTGVRAATPTPVGIGITVASLVVMPALAWMELRVGRELGSASVRVDAKQLLVCVYLSGTVLVGLVVTALLGWTWADPAAALVVAALAVREGLEAWRVEVEPPLEVLETMAASCALAGRDRARRRQAWLALNDEYELEVERTDTRMLIHYAKVDDAVARLHTLVDAERGCCGFASWDVDDSHRDLRLVIQTAPGGLAGLSIPA